MKIYRAGPQLVFTFENRFSSTGWAVSQPVRYIFFRLRPSYLSATSHTGRKSCRVKSLYMKRFWCVLTHIQNNNSSSVPCCTQVSSNIILPAIERCAFLFFCSREGIVRSVHGKISVFFHLLLLPRVKLLIPYKRKLHVRVYF
jgi:hypothetical protein